MKRILPGIYVLLIVTYFASEALLRRAMYHSPKNKSASKDALVNRLPDFLQTYFKQRQKVADLEAQLEATGDPITRVNLLYSLAAESSKSKQAGLMEQIVKEAPTSPKTIRAWGTVLVDMSEAEILDRYIKFINQCDIRTHQDKVSAWQTGLHVIKSRSPKGYRDYVQLMVKQRVCDHAFEDAYEMLRLSRDVPNDIANEARDLRNICRNMQGTRR